MKRFDRRFVILVVFATLFIGLACSLGNIVPMLAGATETAIPTQPPAVQVQPTKPAPTLAATQAPAKTTQATVKPTVAQVATQAPSTGAPEIADVQAGLDKVDSYRMAISMVVDGKNSSGAAVTQTLTLAQEIIKSKESMHFGMASTGLVGAAAFGNIDIFQIGKVGYMSMADPTTKKNTCLSYSSDKPAFDTDSMIKPEDMFSDVQAGALVAKGETVNGVKADHYKLKNAGITAGTTKNETGDMWVAQDGGYLVKVVATADGDFSMLGDTISGKMTLNYNLNDVNKVTAITLPKECQDQVSGTSDLPIPPNATDQASLGGIITFSSPDSPKTVGDFYRKQATTQGWKVVSDSALDVLVMISIQKDTRTFSIMITTGTNNSGSSVVITQTK
jgi:hypothetical protein